MAQQLHIVRTAVSYESCFKGPQIVAENRHDIWKLVIWYMDDAREKIAVMCYEIRLARTS